MFSIRGRLHDDGAVDHVHAAGEAELATAVRHKLDGGLGEREQRLADSEVGEDDARGALAGLLPVEHQPCRHSLTQVDAVWRIAAFTMISTCCTPPRSSACRVARGPKKNQANPAIRSIPAVVTTSSAPILVHLHVRRASRHAGTAAGAETVTTIVRNRVRTTGRPARTYTTTSCSCTQCGLGRGARAFSQNASSRHRRHCRRRAPPCR